MELKACPFCKREMVLLPKSEVDDNAEPCWGHPRNTPREECFIHSLIIYRDQSEHWNRRAQASEGEAVALLQGWIKNCLRYPGQYHETSLIGTTQRFLGMHPSTDKGE